LELSSKTRLCGLIGDPVEHSISPQILNAAFEAANLNFIYVTMNVKKRELASAIKGMRALGIHGLNVTIPHKVNVVRYLDHVDGDARMIGAVNTILNVNGELRGFNTDGIGAARAIEESGTLLDGKSVVLIGSGGAARAIAFAFSNKVDRLTILNRHADKARKLAVELTRKKGKRVHSGDLQKERLRETLSDAQIVINATSVGMFPNEDTSILDGMLLRPDLVVIDIVYNPLQTKLLREAAEVGAKTVNGVGMLVHQGAEAFKIWTEKEAPVELMRQVAMEELSRLNRRV
jgi:shikimate dehydrogenase